MSSNKGWECPKCGNCWAPHIQACNTCMVEIAERKRSIEKPDPIEEKMKKIKDLFPEKKPWNGKDESDPYLPPKSPWSEKWRPPEPPICLEGVEGLGKPFNPGIMFTTVPNVKGLLISPPPPSKPAPENIVMSGWTNCPTGEKVAGCGKHYRPAKEGEKRHNWKGVWGGSCNSNHDNICHNCQQYASEVGAESKCNG